MKNNFYYSCDKFYHEYLQKLLNECSSGKSENEKFQCRMKSYKTAEDFRQNVCKQEEYNRINTIIRFF